MVDPFRIFATWTGSDPPVGAAFVGEEVGAIVGALVGTWVGVGVGAELTGALVGGEVEMVGSPTGAKVGAEAGAELTGGLVEIEVGSGVGELDTGVFVGAAMGAANGAPVPDTEDTTKLSRFGPPPSVVAVTSTEFNPGTQSNSKESVE
mmetsp:Transcript_2882/g.4506  ORF Transcript_2882/g.4506 Transcript_2882/m.4506 type:complete len:149 (-) Transcript_2882:596-1042(-)